MSSLPQPVRRETALAAGAAAAALLEDLVLAVAGPGDAPVSLTLDYGARPRTGESVVAEAWVERATRTLFFISARLTRAADGAVLITGSAVLRRAADVQGAA